MGITSNFAEAAQVLSGSPYAGKNFLINGDFMIAQRGTSFNSTAVLYTLDRWASYNVSATGVTVSQQGPSTGNPTNAQDYWIRYQRNSGTTGTDLRLYQIVESVNARRMAGLSVTLTFWARAGANFSPTSGQLSPRLITGTGADQGLTSVASGSWTGQTTLINGSAALTTSWQQFTFTATVATGVQEIAVGFIPTWVGTAGANDYYEVALVQLEVGSYQTQFERLQFQDQFARCLRYYRKGFSYATAPANGTADYGAGFQVQLQATATLAIQGRVQFEQDMRTTPTITFYNPRVGGTAATYTNSTADDTGAAAAANPSTKGFMASSSSATLAASNWYVNWTASAEL